MSTAPETKVQSLVHNLEQGTLATIVRRVLFVVVFLTIGTVYIVYKFRGLETGTGMDQAQIAREIARGHGFVTQDIRPLAVAQLVAHKKPININRLPDTYHAPLNPLVEALPLQFVKDGWNTESKGQELIYAGDRLVAILALIFFFLAVTVNYFTARLLFDQRLAALGTSLVLLCDMFWKYSMSGLPQMLMLLIFSGIIQVLVRAIVAQSQSRPVGLHLVGIGILFGLLGLCNGLTIWILLGALVFIGIQFRPRGIAAVMVLCVFLAVYSPWIVRNIQVSGTPFGIALYSQLDDVKQSETAWMRQSDTGLGGVGISWYRSKIVDQTIDQSGRLFSLLGFSVTAPLFFVALLHPFKRRETSVLRWAILSMWLFAFLGMTIAGLQKDPITPNQLHLLFVPMMIFYGFAFLMTLWSRLEIDFPLARITFIVVIFLASSVQLILTMLPASNATRLVWPPYAPPIIAVFNKWMLPSEITASDMPWAVAWYADRKSLLLPATVEDFNTLNDYNQLGMPVNGIYLTPITSHLGLFPNVAGGEYKSWAGFILRSSNALDKFPLKSFVPLPINGESVFYSDHDRWTNN